MTRIFANLSTTRELLRGALCRVKRKLICQQTEASLSFDESVSHCWLVELNPAPTAQL